MFRLQKHTLACTQAALEWKYTVCREKWSQAFFAYPFCPVILQSLIACDATLWYHLIVLLGVGGASGTASESCLGTIICDGPEIVTRGQQLRWITKAVTGSLHAGWNATLVLLAAAPAQGQCQVSLRHDGMMAWITRRSIYPIHSK